MSVTPLTNTNEDAEQRVPSDDVAFDLDFDYSVRIDGDDAIFL